MSLESFADIAKLFGLDVAIDSIHEEGYHLPVDVHDRVLDYVEARDRLLSLVEAHTTLEESE